VTAGIQRVELAARRWFAAWCAAAALCCGCDQTTTPTQVFGPDLERAPEYIQARRSCDLLEFKASAQHYEKLLATNPDFAKGHFEAALLYDDKLADPVMAVYHYRRFLELEPNSDKRKLIEDFIERATVSIVAKLPQSAITDPAEVSRLREQNAVLTRDNEALKARVADFENAAAAANARTQTMTAPEVEQIAQPMPPPTNVVVTPSPPKTGETPPRVHVVQKGDTLQAIAMKYYGTRSAWTKILEANKGALPDKDQIKVGQQLLIP
jgi:LysM repeat protein